MNVTGVCIRAAAVFFAVAGLTQGQSIPLDEELSWNAPQGARVESHDGITVPVSTRAVKEEETGQKTPPEDGPKTAGTAKPAAAPAPPAPVRPLPPAPPVIYPPDVNPARNQDDLRRLETGTERQALEKQLGAPSARVFIPGEEGLEELQLYSGKSGHLGTVKLTGGAVSSVEVEPKK